MDEIRRSLSAALEARRNEIEEAFRTRVNAIGNIQEVHDVEYLEGLRSSISKAFDFALMGISGSRGSVPAIPPVLLTQARLAARNGIDLAVVQRRYMACYHLLDEFLSEEAERHGPPATGALWYIRRTTRSLFEMLLDTVEEEHTRERRHPASPEQRRVELVRSLLDGKRVDHSELAYDFHVSHLGLLTRGAEAASAIKDLARNLDCLPLVVRLDDEAVWGWLGRREGPDIRGFERLLGSDWPADTPLGVGEPAKNMNGWRHTFRQANGAFSLALRRPGGIFRYGDDPLLVTIAQDDLQVARLRESYLDPLAAEPDGGSKARATLRAYIASDRNASSAGAALGINRQTVLNRLRKVEQRIGRPITNRMDEIGAALRLEELDHSPTHRQSGEPEI